MIPAALIFAGLIAALLGNASMMRDGTQWPDFLCACFGCGLIVTGASMLVGG